MSHPNPLARHYSRFRVAERLLLTGHSHQAWPDVGFEAQQRAWLDAAEYVDTKWDRAMACADRVQQHWKYLLHDSTGDITLGQNTHELIVRLLSALPLSERRRIVTTDAEFHTIRRQLDRLAEEGLEIVKVRARPGDALADRLVSQVTDGTAAVLVSSVLYETAEIVPDLDRVAVACARRGAVLLIDAYHHINALPFDVAALELEEAFITGGGYKYCQLGEGNAFLRIPAACGLRPVITGWFSEFADLGEATPSTVQYGDGPSRFAGATYDPTSHYRADAVQQFHKREGLTPNALREISQHQVGLLEQLVQALDADPALLRVEPLPPARRAGFLALRSPFAHDVSRELRTRGVSSDVRGDVLRLGPAPYLSDDQLHQAIDALEEALSALPQR